MKDALADIREKLRNGLYQNEEHVRLSLVARVLRELGWDIWNPKEVNAEFVAAPEEDKTKVDLALFATPQVPAVFIEVKAVGKITDLTQIERQLRDYNRNILVPACVITDGNKWRFYSSRAPGEFAKKCFKELVLQSDDLDDVAQALVTFLQKSSILNGDSEKEAKALLTLTQKEKAMEECLSKARRLTEKPPYPSWPQALVTCVRERGFEISQEEAADAIGKAASVQPPPERVDNPEPPHHWTGSDYGPNQPPDLSFTTILKASIGNEHAKKWNRLVFAGILIACERGISVSELRSATTVSIREGAVSKHGFRIVEGTNLSFMYMPANSAWANALALARMLNVELKAHFRWRDKKGAARPGQEGMLHFRP